MSFFLLNFDLVTGRMGAECLRFSDNVFLGEWHEGQNLLVATPSYRW